MDRQQLLHFLRESQQPDTQRLKAATAELQKNYYPHPESLLLLIEIVCTHDDVGVRQLAAVQANRLVLMHWKTIPTAQKSAVKQHLVEATLKEQNAKCRHSNARLVAAIASLDFDDGEWPNLIPNLFNLARNSDHTQREVGSYIIYSTIEANPNMYNESVHELIELFSHTINDPESADVRVNTMLSIGAMLILVDSDEDKSAVAALQNLIPPMGAVLKAAIDAGDEEKVKQGFEVLQQFLAYESSFLGPHLKNLLQFMIEAAANIDADEDVRVQAFSFLTQAVQYRRMKIQGMSDMPKQLVIRSLQTLTEDEDDDADELTPRRAAIGLLDELARDLPPRLVLVPLLDEFPKYSAHSDAAYRRAGILALGTCAEGAPDFVNTQLKMILPILIQLLNDPERQVRHAAIVGLTNIAEEMADELADEHAALIAALSKNLQAAMVESSDEQVAKKNVAVIRSACAALDAMCAGIKAEVMAEYAQQLIEPIGRLLSHPMPKVKIASASALGAIAESLGAEFKPFFEKTMRTLGSYISIKDTEEDLDLRSGVCDSMGRIAVAVGPEPFQPYVLELMKSSEEALNLENERLRESCFILWAQLAKVYGKEFKPFLAGVFKGLFEALELEESDVVLELTEDEQAIIGDAKDVVIGGKRWTARLADDVQEGILMDDDEDDDGEGWEDFGSAEAMEKEVALEVLGDVIVSACGQEEVAEYLEKSLEIARTLTEHPYDGIRKAAITTLWRSYARVWQLMEEETGTKWEAGFPPKQPTTTLLAKLGELVVRPTLASWPEENDRTTVTDINRNVAATLKACGPAILAQGEMLTEMLSVLGLIITRSHQCQQDLGDEGMDPEDGQESSEYDWLVIDTALDLIIALSMAMGQAFGELWKVFEKPVMKFASSNEAQERSTAVGVISDCIKYMGPACTPYTSNMLKLLLHRLSDEDPETRSNACYGIGQLIANSTDSKTYLPSFSAILGKMDSLLHSDPGHRIFDNAAGCVCRMITAHPDRVPIEEVIPTIVDGLPLTEDFEENVPIYACIFKLYQHNEPTVMGLTPRFISIFEKVLGPPNDQLEAETRALIQQAVQILHKGQPELFQAHPELLKLSGMS